MVISPKEIFYARLCNLQGNLQDLGTAVIVPVWLDFPVVIRHRENLVLPIVQIIDLFNPCQIVDL